MISVCITSVRPDHIDEAVSSILDDAENVDRDIEIIVGAVGGFSFDLEGHCRVIELDVDATIPESRNRLIEESQGDYIGILDDDDRWIEGRIEKSLQLLENGFECVCSPEYQNIESKQEENIDITEEMCITHSSMMYSNDWRYREKFELAEDVDMIMRMLSEGHKVAALDTKLAERDTSDSHHVGGNKKQDFFFTVALIFYRQRINHGFDRYDVWDVEPPCDFDKLKNSLNSKVLNPPPIPSNRENKILKK